MCCKKWSCGAFILISDGEGGGGKRGNFLNVNLFEQLVLLYKSINHYRVREVSSVALNIKPGTCQDERISGKVC